MTLNSPNVPEELKDEVILAASLENPSLFEILVKRYQEPFLRAAGRVVRKREDAEDVVQEAFLKIYRNAHRFEKREDIEFKSWAYRIVLNTSFTHYQKLKRRGVNEDYEGDELLRTVISERDNPNTTTEVKILIEQVLADMPPELGALLTKHYLEDKAYGVIAKEEQTTAAAIKMRLYRARQVFKKLLSGDTGHTKEKPADSG